MTKERARNMYVAGVDFGFSNEPFITVIENGQIHQFKPECVDPLEVKRIIINKYNVKI